MAGRSLPEESCCGASEPMFLVYIKGLKGVLVDTCGYRVFIVNEKFMMPEA
jgi:hypothetical protein